MEKNNFASFFYNTLINSLIFSPYIEKDLVSYFDNYDRERYFDIIQNFGLYIAKLENRQLVDIKVSNNIYKIVLYLSEKFTYESDEDVILINDFMNSVKGFLNVCPNDNCDYIREQILIRDYGVKKSNFNRVWKDLIKIPDEGIENWKAEYYDSISSDVLVLCYLQENSDIFYSEDYKRLLLDRNFYRSVNYFLLTNPDLFLDEEYFNRINFVVDKNIDLLDELSVSNSEDNLDDEFFAIHNTSVKLLKKFKKQNKLKYVKNIIKG